MKAVLWVMLVLQLSLLAIDVHRSRCGTPGRQWAWAMVGHSTLMIGLILGLIVGA